MKKALYAGLMIGAALLAVPALSDDLLGKKGGGKGGGGGSGGSGGGGKSGGGSGGNRGGQDPPPQRSGGSNNGGTNSGNSGGGSRDPRTGGDPGGGFSRDPGMGGSQSSQGGGSGRMTRNPRSDDNLLGKRPENAGSRSGRVGYGSSSNQGRNRGGQPTIDRVPEVGSTRGLDRDANRQPQITRTYDKNDFRRGYNHYRDDWRDDWFWYPHYGFSYTGNVVPSPFYFYSHLPAYINVGRVTIIVGSPVIYGRCRDRYDYRAPRINWNTGWNTGWNNGWDDDWSWSNTGGWGRGRNELDRSVDDIIYAFWRGDARQMSSLVPSRDRILIDINDQGRYTLDGDDFYDMFQDLVGGTRTTGYRIREVRTDRGYATVVAEHQYRDAWGWNQRSIHIYGLEEDRRGYQIREFSVRRG